jgi:DNA-binding GntR family transcriptional regulator
LRRLEAEGWVRFTPNVGAVVSPVDSTTWEQAMITLAILEGAASAEAQQNLRRSDLTRLRKIAAGMEEAAARADPMRFSKLNRLLHAAIVARCPNTYLMELLEQTNSRLDRLRSTMFAYLPHRSEEALGEHLHLIELLESGSKEDVESYARWHKLRTVEAYRAIHQANDQARRRHRPLTTTPPRPAPRPGHYMICRAMGQLRPAITPPSTFQMAPVTQLVAGESRNVMVLAMSRAVPVRPSGWKPSKLCRVASSWSWGTNRS